MQSSAFFSSLSATCAAGHPLLFAHASRTRPTLRLSEAVEPRRLSHSQLYGDLLRPSGVEYCITIGVRTEPGEMVVAGLGRTEREFSERDRDILDLVRPVLEDALRDAEARQRLVLALAADPQPGSAVLLLDRYGEIEQSSLDAERWLGEHFGAAEHAGWLPGPRRRVARSAAAHRSSAFATGGASRSTCCREIRTRCCSRRRSRASARTHSIASATPRETEVLCAATTIEEEADIAWELCLILHAARDRLAHLEAKLGVHTAADAKALRESA
jgi:hypothetical protein